MKRYSLLLPLLAFIMAQSPDLAMAESHPTASVAELRPMLVDGKTWVYVYHHFEDKASLTGNESYEDMFDETCWEVRYTVSGDTVIDDRQYKKMYRWDESSGKNAFYAPLREDEEGRVWQYDYSGDGLDFMLCDVTCASYPGQQAVPLTDAISVNGQLLHRYRWMAEIGVECVGFAGKGIVHYLYEPQPDCICDYESLAWVYGGGIYFHANDFTAPRYIELTQDERQLVAQTNDFAFRLFRKASTTDNKLLSPLSVTYALGMLNNGAAGQTRHEICQVLGCNDIDAQNAFCLKMIDQLAGASWMDDNTKALISNTIFVNQGRGYQLHPDFTQTVNHYYYANPSARDFNDGQTLDTINRWASDHTEQMIQEVLSENEFNPFAVSYLLNAIYFKGAWSDPFDPDETHEESFAGGGNVQMMHREHADLSYAENDLYQLVSIPYGNGTYAMHVLLPREGKTLDELLQSLDGATWKLHGSSCDVDLKLPRIEVTTSQDLTNIMAELGMPSAFNPETADFSRLCVGTNGGICIGQMKQVAKIKLDEQGTEAAAVTVISMPTGMPRQVAFHANRPFLYIISEQSTGIILFIGQFLGDVALSVPTLNTQLSTPQQTVNRQFFDLTGRRLAAPPASGLYIENGTLKAK